MAAKTLLETARASAPNRRSAKHALLHSRSPLQPVRGRLERRFAAFAKETLV